MDADLRGWKEETGPRAEVAKGAEGRKQLRRSEIFIAHIGKKRGELRRSDI
jgi:hypothetical protein